MEPIEPLMLADDLCIYSRDVLENPLSGQAPLPEDPPEPVVTDEGAPANKVTEMY